ALPPRPVRLGRDAGMPGHRPVVATVHHGGKPSTPITSKPRRMSKNEADGAATGSHVSDHRQGIAPDGGRWAAFTDRPSGSILNAQSESVGPSNPVIEACDCRRGERRFGVGGVVH